jgi:hypothetical protein
MPVGDQTNAELVADNMLLADSFATENAKYQVPPAICKFSNLTVDPLANTEPLLNICVLITRQSVAAGVALDV